MWESIKLGRVTHFMSSVTEVEVRETDGHREKEGDIKTNMDVCVNL